MLKIKGTGNRGFTIIEMAIVTVIGLMFLALVFAVMFNATNSSITGTVKIFDKLQLQEASKHLSTHIESSSYTHIKDASEQIADSGPILELFNYDHILTGTYSRDAITGDLVFSDPVTGDTTFENVTCVFDIVRQNGTKVTEIKIDYSSPYNSTAIIACGLSAGDSWVKVFGGLDVGFEFNPPQMSWSLGRMRRTHDGGYIIVNGTNYFNNAEFWGYLLKIDRHGDMQWSRTFAPLTGNFGDASFSIAEVLKYEAPDLVPDGYIVASSNMGGELLRVDHTGAFLWHRRFTIGGFNFQTINSVEQVFRLETAGGNHLEADGYIMAGGQIATTIMGYVIKTDVNGDRQWEKGIYADDTGYHSVLSNIKQTFDAAGDPSGYIAIGTGKYLGPGSGDIYLVKLDTSGVHEWSQIFDNGGTNKHDIGANVLQTRDGGYILSGASSWIKYIIKTNSSGDHQWSKLFGGGVGVPYSTQEVTIPGGGYIIAGYTGLPHATSFQKSCYLIKISTQGNIVTGGVDTGWARVFGGEKGSGAYSIEMAFNEKDKFDGYVFQGHSLSYGVGMPIGRIEGYIVKTDLRGHCPESENPERIDDPFDHLNPSFDMSAATLAASSFDNPCVWIGSDDGVEKYSGAWGAPLLTVNFTNSPRVAVNHMDKSLWTSDNGLSANNFDSQMIYVDHNGTVLMSGALLPGEITDLAVVTNTERPDNNFCWFADTWAANPGAGIIVKMSLSGAITAFAQNPYGIVNGEELRIAVNSRDGSLWYTDTENDRIVKLDANGIPDTSGNFPIIINPAFLSGIDIDLNDGSCVVLDYGSNRVRKFREDGSPILPPWNFGGPPPGDIPGGIAVNQIDSSVWTARRNGAGNTELVVFDSAGILLGFREGLVGASLNLEFAPNPFQANSCIVLDRATGDVFTVIRNGIAPNFLSITVTVDEFNNPMQLNNPTSIGMDMGDFIATMQDGLLPDSHEVDTANPPTGIPTWSETGTL